MKVLLTFVIALSIAGRLIAAGSAVDGPGVDLIYDVRTGDVVLDASDTVAGNIRYFTLRDPEGRLNPEASRSLFQCPGDVICSKFQLGCTV